MKSASFHAQARLAPLSRGREKVAGTSEGPPLPFVVRKEGKLELVVEVEVRQRDHSRKQLRAFAAHVVC
jgi:hypothetical protein